MEHYVGFTPLGEILKSTSIKYLRQKLNEAEARLCSSYVCSEIHKKIAEVEIYDMQGKDV